MEPTYAEVEKYYDHHITQKITDFVEGNPRVDHAFRTVVEWTPDSPVRILDVGCGVGYFAWYLSRQWPQAAVTGLDISPKSIETANQLFATPTRTFVKGLLTPGMFNQPFDLITMIDVYEHILPTDRVVIHSTLRNLLSERGRLVLNCPTPRHLTWLKKNIPDQIQPVDEDIDLPAILQLSRDVSREVLLYKEVDIWYPGDYVQCVLGNREKWSPANEIPVPRLKRLKKRLVSAVTPAKSVVIPSKKERLHLVKTRLGTYE